MNTSHAGDHDWVEDDTIGYVYCQICGAEQPDDGGREALATRIVGEIAEGYYTGKGGDTPPVIDIVTQTLGLLTEWQLLGDDIG